MAGLQWLDCMTCNHKLVGSNPMKLTADVAMTRMYCRVVTEPPFLGFAIFIIIDVEPMSVASFVFWG